MNHEDNLPTTPPPPAYHSIEELAGALDTLVDLGLVLREWLPDGRAVYRVVPTLRGEQS